MHVLRTAVICCEMNDSVTTGPDFDRDEKQNSISFSQLVVLLPTKCVTGERDSLSPRKVPSSTSIHTGSYTPSVRWILKRLVFWGWIIKPRIASGCEVGVYTYYKPKKIPIGSVNGRAYPSNPHAESKCRSPAYASYRKPNPFFSSSSILDTSKLSDIHNSSCSEGASLCRSTFDAFRTVMEPLPAIIHQNRLLSNF